MGASGPARRFARSLRPLAAYCEIRKPRGGARRGAAHRVTWSGNDQNLARGHGYGLRNPAFRRPAVRRRNPVLSTDHRQGVRGGRGHRQRHPAHGRGGARVARHAGPAGGGVRLVLRDQPGRQDRLLRHRRSGPGVLGQAARREHRPLGPAPGGHRRALGDRAGGAPRRHPAGRIHAGRPRVRRRSRQGRLAPAGQAAGGARLVAGPRPEDRHHLRRHRRPRQGVQHRRHAGR